MVSDAYASYLSGVACGTFIVSAQADSDSAEAATEALLAEVDTLARLPLEAEELARARALLAMAEPGSKLAKTYAIHVAGIASGYPAGSI